MNYPRPVIIGLLALATGRTPNPGGGQHGCSLGPGRAPLARRRHHRRLNRGRGRPTASSLTVRPSPRLPATTMREPSIEGGGYA